MTLFWIIAILLIGQGLLAITLVKVVRTLGVYTERLTLTHQQNLQMRQNLATIENEIAIRAMLHRNPPPGKEKVS